MVVIAQNLYVRFETLNTIDSRQLTRFSGSNTVGEKI